MTDFCPVFRILSSDENLLSIEAKYYVNSRVLAATLWAFYVIPLNSEEGTFFLNVILSMAYSRFNLESGANDKMGPLASILREREQWVARSSVFFLEISDHFTVVYSVAWPLNERESGVDLLLIEMSLEITQRASSFDG